jgi:hypothetical protein
MSTQKQTRNPPADPAYDCTVTFRDENNVLTTIQGQLVIRTIAVPGQPITTMNQFIADPGVRPTTVPRVRGAAALNPVSLPAKVIQRDRYYQDSHADRILSGITSLFS